MDGLFGKPLEFRALRFPRRGTKYYRRNGWAGKLNFEGRSILDSPLQHACAHEMQVMLFLLGSGMRTSTAVESVEAETWQGRPDIENYDAAAVRLVTGSGVKVLFFTAHCIEESSLGPLGEFRFEKAVVKWDGSSGPGFTAVFNDGRKKSYNVADDAGDFRKLYDAVDAVRSGVPPVCTLQTARPHLQCVTLVQQFPIKKVSSEKLGQGSTEDGDMYYYIPGLSAAFVSSYEKGVLPSEIGFTV